MSKRGAGERDGFTPSQGNMRKARVEVRRVDAIQVLMAAARSRNSQPQQLPSQQQPAATAAAVAVGVAGGPPCAAPPTSRVATYLPAPAAPCTHCGAVLPVSADSCSLRQCCGCLDVFCSLCSVVDYEEREDRVFCLGCLDDQAAVSRSNRGRCMEAGVSNGRSNADTSGLLSLPLGGEAGRWGQLDLGGHARSPFPASRTPQQPQAGSRTPGSALYSSRSHRGFSSLLAFGGAGS